MKASKRGLLCVGVGAALAALPVGLVTSSAGLGCRLLGACLLATGAWLLRPVEHPLLTRRLGYASALLSVWAALVLLDSAALGLALLLAGAAAGGDALRRLAELNAWSYATRAWRNTTRVAAVVYGVSLLVVASMWALGGSEEDLVYRLVSAAWVALPALSAVRAAAFTTRDQAQAADAPVPPVARWATGRGGLAVAIAVLLSPLWVLIPVCAHKLWNEKVW